MLTGCLQPHVLRITRPKGRVRIETSAWTTCAAAKAGITRPKGRVRIETSASGPPTGAACASPGRKAGCGLKLGANTNSPTPAPCITRPKGRVRIETAAPCRTPWRCHASPGRKAGCGLKQFVAIVMADVSRASPGRKAGCGLKRQHLPAIPQDQPHHPAERPGAD